MENLGNSDGLNLILHGYIKPNYLAMSCPMIKDREVVVIFLLDTVRCRRLAEYKVKMNSFTVQSLIAIIVSNY